MRLERESRCVFICGNKKGGVEMRRVMGDGNDFTTTTTAPKVMNLFYYSVNIPTSHSIVTKTSRPSNATQIIYF